MAVRDEGKLIFAANLGRYSNRNQHWVVWVKRERFPCLLDNQTIATRLQATKMARRGDLASGLTIISTVQAICCIDISRWPSHLVSPFPRFSLSFFKKITCATEIKVPALAPPPTTPPLMILHASLIHLEKNTPSNLDGSSHCAATAVCRAKLTHVRSMRTLVLINYEPPRQKTQPSFPRTV